MYLKVKRCIDLILSVAALIILSPFMLLIAVAVTLDSPGPAFFKQSRRGKDGRIFSMYKFRSMVIDAEHQGTGLFNYENDPRVTRVGRFLRNTSLDELPQLLNVVRGDMALVGPRPCVSYELGDYDTLNRRYKKRFEVLPGITGLAQVFGRNEIPWDVKVDYDNRYVDEVKRHGFRLDAEILFRTVVKVFSRCSIYEECPEDMNAEQAAAETEAMIIELAHRTDSTEREKEEQYDR